MDILIWGAIVRMAQAVIAAAPTILVGWLIAAVFERILGREGTFRLFGGNTWKQLPYAWLLGMLLPVCSLGVIPVMVQMRKSGIAGGTILAFGLTAPLFNPISVLYGLTLSDPIAIFVFCLGSLTIVTVLGVCWDWLHPRTSLVPESLPATQFGLKRVAAVGLSMCEQAFSKSTLYILIAIVGVGALSMMLPVGCLQHAAGKNDPKAPLVMALVATLAYITPMVAIVQIASMFQHGNSIGAAFTLLVLGAGANLGLIAWSFSEYGWKPALKWIGGMIAMVLVISYAVDGPLAPPGVEPADHTHAFDIYCNPFSMDTSDAAHSSWQLINESWKAEELIALCLAMVFMCAGGAFRLGNLSQRWMARLVQTKDQEQRGSQLSRDIVLPKSVIAAASFGGLIAASFIGCFLYYPPASDIRKEMNIIQAELQSDCSFYEWEKIAYWIPIQEDWANKMTVSCYLRGRPLTRFQQMKLRVFLKKLELLEHAAEDQDKKETDRWKLEASTALQRFKNSQL